MRTFSGQCNCLWRTRAFLEPFAALVILPLNHPQSLILLAIPLIWILIMTPIWKAAIEASLRDVPNKAPSAPSSVDFPQPVALTPHRISTPPEPRLTNSLPTLPDYDMDPRESDTIMTFTQTVEQVQHDPNGRDISRYPMLNQLYDQANGLRPKLAMSLDERAAVRVSPFMSTALYFVTKPV